MSTETLRIRDRTVIEMCFLDGLTKKECYEKGLRRYGRNRPCKNTIKKYYNQLTTNQFQYTSKKPPGRPRNFRKEMAVRRVVLEHGSYSIAKFAKIAAVDRKTVADVVYRRMNFIKLTSYTVPHPLTQQQKVDRVNKATQLVQTLHQHSSLNFRSVFTGDESYFSFSFDHPFVWGLRGAQHLVRINPLHRGRKIMPQVFQDASNLAVLDYQESKNIGTRDTRRRKHKLFGALTIAEAESDEEEAEDESGDDEEVMVENSDTDFQDRTVIEMCFLDGLTKKECYEKGLRRYGRNRPCKNTIKKYYNQLTTNQFQYTSKKPPGRPRNFRKEMAVRRVVLEHGSYSIAKFAKIAAVDRKTVADVVYRRMNFIKLTSYTVPHPLTQQQKVDRVNKATQLVQTLHQHSSLNFRSVFTGDESYFSFSFDHPFVWGLRGAQHLVRINPLHRGRKIMCLRPMERYLDRQVDVEVPYQLHYDNAKPHPSRTTRTFMNDTNFSVLTHPAYSPDLSPCDFAIFPVLKQRLIGRRFATIPSLTRAILAEMERITPQQRIRIFQNWIKRCDHVIRRGGEYYDKCLQEERLHTRRLNRANRQFVRDDHDQLQLDQYITYFQVVAVFICITIMITLLSHNLH
ncbi:putative mariner transposase [Blattamonas nauphoetae]|uniref:Mariner transposase n=1 Tax=Blattamonas nauphoetae TaxID=2049346 RepID=A0ABQ9X2R4_9EUKA|nr:putative mariner transposase [Blattamonas nauphoetae]